MIDSVLFKDLMEKDPGEVTDRCNVRYDAGTGTYSVRFWNRIVRVTPAENKVDCHGMADTTAWAYVPLIVVHYLLSAGKAGVGDVWVSEKDLPGGTAFFRGPHLLPVHLLIRKFEGSVQRFDTACRKLDAKPLGMADAAFSFPLLPGIPGAVLFWDADEMFAADAKILFDKSIARHLPLDIVYALGVTLCRVLADAGDFEPV